MTSDRQSSNDELETDVEGRSCEKPAPGLENKRETLNPFQVIGSVFAAGLGVQSSKNRERDFKQGRAATFIVAGLLFTALFIGTVYTVVSMVLSSR
ncbi:DUF2970 domain-containing protein [Congregibacter variabilis]|uniref:DUF2970 domain-containing protein n=1 Tax=Congregibacter variabilis TaxID=3081200 RepID=A0ABZ0I520_9GAMM|nr:DUF2970 domain-containing protein [Congregibacter sp. IMCC43200]